MNTPRSVPLRLLVSVPMLVPLGSAQAIVAGEASAPERIFDELWRTYDRNYALFAVKEAHWNDLYRVYRPRVHAHTTDEQLFVVLAELLGHLDDNHALLETPKGHPDTYLVTGSLSKIEAGVPRNRTNEGFSVDLIDSAYVQGTLATRLGGTFSFGKLSPTIGYLRLSAFDFVEPTAAAMDEFMELCQDVEGIVVDLRENGGGSTESALEVLGRFASSPRVFASRRMRHGVEQDAFTEPIPVVVEPTGASPFSGPVLVLTSEFSQSAADMFALAARTLPNVTLVGEPTSGSFSTVLGLRLENGWLYSLSYELVLDERGRCWEGIGVPPDLRVVNTGEDVRAGRDRVIEFAHALFESGTLERHDDVEALPRPRSLATALGEWLEESEPAVALEQLRSARGGGGYLAAEELWALACERHAAGRKDHVSAILDVLFVDLAGQWMFAVPGRDWNVLLDSNDPDLVRRILAQGRELAPASVVGGRLRERALRELASADER